MQRQDVTAQRLKSKKNEFADNRLNSNSSRNVEAVETCANYGFVWKSRIKIIGMPLICVAFGHDARGRPLVAKGIIAIGQFALGLLSIGQFSLGLFSIGQFALGLAALGQLAMGALVGFGQISIGFFAVGQFVIGKFGRGQFGWAEYLWSPDRTDMEAVAMFETIDWLFQQDLATILENIKDAISLGL